MKPYSQNTFPFRWALYSGLLAGTLDITAAILYTQISSNKGPLIVLKYVASGVIGTDAFSGGLGTALLGLLFHYCIALIWAIVFYLMYSSVSQLVKNKFVMAFLFGIMVWTVMNLAVVPLSNTPPKASFNITNALINVFILIVCIGLPLSLMASKYYRTKQMRSLFQKEDKGT